MAWPCSPGRWWPAGCWPGPSRSAARTPSPRPPSRAPPASETSERRPDMGYLDGFRVTFKQMFEPKVTVQYPEEKRPKPERFHGRHVLNRYEDGMEKCIGCELCAGVCPARCIYVRGADNPPDAPVS